MKSLPPRVIALALCLIVFVSGARAETPAAGFAFTDATRAAGLDQPVIYGGAERKRYILETNGCGVAFFDADGDGWLDVLLLSGSRLEGFAAGREPTNRFYLNNRDGTFRDLTRLSGLALSGWASAVTVGDYDADGRDDLFITYWGQNRLFRNNGDGTFADATARAGLADAGARRWGAGCVFLDYDRDGDLDLFVADYLKFDLASAPSPGAGANCMWKGVAVNCGPKGLPTSTNRLFRNNGDGTFADVSRASEVAGVEGRYAMTATVIDYNDDGWSDIYVACDSTASILYRNDRDGTFTDVALETGTAYSEDGNPQAGMGLAVADFDGDNMLDIFKTHFSDDYPVLYRNTGRGFFEDASRAAGFDHTRYVQWGAGAEDFDNDGWTDLLILTGNVYPEVERVYKDYPHRTPRLIFRNTGAGRFRDVTARSGAALLDPRSSRGAAFGDYDNDGDTDALVMNMNEAPTLLRNEQIRSGSPAAANNWLTLRLVGKVANRSAVGARVRVTTPDGRRQTREVTSQSSYYSHNDPRPHFGLGAGARTANVEVRWASGAIEKVENGQANRIVTIREGETKRPETTGRGASE